MHLVVGVRLGDLAVTDAALPRQSIVGGASIYPFVQNLLLALRAEGLGAAMTTLLVPAEAEVKRAARRSPRTSRWRRTSASATAPTPGRSSSRASRSTSSPSPSASASRSSSEREGPSGLGRAASAAYSAGGTGIELNGVVPGATFRPSPVALLA